MRGKAFKRILAISLLTAMLSFQFLYATIGVVKAVYEELENQVTKIEDTNVSFDVYYKDTNTHYEKLKISEGGVINLYIKLENTGVLNDPKIHISNPNFKINEEKIDKNTYIKSIDIENNDILLNQIVTGEQILQIPIKFEKKDKIDKDVFDRQNTFTFSAHYQSDEKNYKYIEKNISIATSWIAEPSVQITSDYTKYFSLGENGVLLEQTVIYKTSGELPKNEKNMEIEVLSLDGKQPISATVLLDGKEIESDFRDGKIYINRKNEILENNQIIWGNDEETYKILYTYPKDVKIERRNVQKNISCTTKFYGNDNDVITSIQEEGNIEQKGKIIDITYNSTDMVYKGYIQEASNKNTVVEENINVQFSGLNEDINYIKIGNMAFKDSNNKVFAIPNSYCEKTIINKERLLYIFGNDVMIQLENADTGEVIQIINTYTEADSDGNIVITYDKGIKNVLIKIDNKASKVGEFTIKNVKYISGDTGYTKEKIAEFKTLENTIDLKAQSVEQQEKSYVQLQDTVLDGDLKLNTLTFSTMTKNENVTIDGVMYTNDLKYTLLENPEIRIKFPIEVEKIDVHSINLVNAEGMEVDRQNVKLVQESDGKFVIVVGTKGKISDYTSGVFDGIHLLIGADISINKRTPTKQTSVQLEVKTEKETMTKNVNISLQSTTNVITATSVNEYSLDVVNGEGTKEVELQRQENAKNIEVKNDVINANEEFMKNVVILGHLFTDGKENNMGITVKDGITTEGIENDNMAVYYTENENATSDLSDNNNKWVQDLESIQEEPKKYLITIPELQKEQKVTAKYEANIPANLQYNKQVTQGFEVYYTNNVGENKKIASEDMKLFTGQSSMVEATLEAQVGGIKKDNVSNGEIIRYVVNVKNTGKQNAKNVQINCPIPEGTTLIEQKAVMLEEGIEPTGEPRELIDTLPFIKKESEKQVTYTIDNLEVGKSVTKYYDVLVLDSLNEGQKIENIVTLTFDEQTKETNKIIHNIEKGDIKVRVGSILDSAIRFGTVHEYPVLIYNSTNTPKKNLNLEMLVDDNLMKVVRITNGDDEVTSTDDNGLKQFTIDEIPANSYIEISIEVSLKSFGDSANRDTFIATKITDGLKQYYSNQMDAKLVSTLLSMDFKTENEGSTVKADDIIEYNITIKNDGDNDVSNINITDLISNELVVQEITSNGTVLKEDEDYSIEDIEDNVDYSQIQMLVDVKAKESLSINIKAKVDNNPSINNEVKIENKVSTNLNGGIISEGTVYHILKVEEEKDDIDETDNPSEPINPNDPDNPTNDENTSSITGIAWLDENENGIKDSQETPLEGIVVKLINPDNSNIVKDSKGTEIKATTESDGLYMLRNIPKGRYMVIFEYDTSIYGVTLYKKDGVQESQNSNAFAKEISIDGIKKTVGATDVLTTDVNDINNINIGLKKVRKFDLKLDKYVTNIKVKNAEGEHNYNFDNSKLAKVEINKKYIDNTIITTTYKIKVTNAGDTEGYVKQVVDYLPEDYTFNLNENTGWRKKGKEIYNNSLENVKLLPGESREITLIVNKKMTQNNTGVIINAAEIAEAYNERGLQDINSTPANRNNKENDYSIAEVIVSIKTGGIIIASIIAGIVVAIVGVIIYILKFRRRV